MNLHLSKDSKNLFFTPCCIVPSIYLETEFKFKIFTRTITGEHKLFPLKGSEGDYPVERKLTGK